MWKYHERSEKANVHIFTSKSGIIFTGPNRLKYGGLQQIFPVKHSNYRITETLVLTKRSQSHKLKIWNMKWAGSMKRGKWCGMKAHIIQLEGPISNNDLRTEFEVLRENVFVYIHTRHTLVSEYVKRRSLHKVTWLHNNIPYKKMVQHHQSSENEATSLHNMYLRAGGIQRKW